MTMKPLFRRKQVITIFCRVFGEARRRFVFELRGFWLEEEWLSFYIKPADGLQLPAIMQWLKQTFAVRFYLHTERRGLVWGDRYWSRVLEGEPPEGARDVDWEAVDVAAETGELSSGKPPSNGVSPLATENPMETRFSPQTPPDPRRHPVSRQSPAQNRAGTPTQTSFIAPSENGNGRTLSETPHAAAARETKAPQVSPQKPLAVFSPIKKGAGCSSRTLGRAITPLSSLTALA
jgi:hypothetical protein